MAVRQFNCLIFPCTASCIGLAWILKPSSFSGLQAVHSISLVVDAQINICHGAVQGGLISRLEATLLLTHKDCWNSVKHGALLVS